MVCREFELLKRDRKPSNCPTITTSFRLACLRRCIDRSTVPGTYASEFQLKRYGASYLSLTASRCESNDWAYQALQSLVERYGCIAGFPDATFRGQQALTRYEFAAALNTCLDRMNELIAASIANSASDADLLVLQRLQTEFAIELAALGDRVNHLEARTAELEANQFSTTTLSGGVIIAVNGGGFAVESIVDANGVEVANSNPNSTLLYRTTLTFNTSFFGTDQLRIALSTGSSEGGFDNTTGILEPSLGSGLDFSVKPPTNEVIGLSRAFYTFTPLEDVSVSIGPNIRTTDYLDRNSFANQSDRDFSTLAFVNNYLLFPLFGPAAGGEVEWNPGESSLTLRALYAASDASNPNGSDTAPNQAIASFVNLLFPPAPGSPLGELGEPPLVPASERGLFGDTYRLLSIFGDQASWIDSKARVLVEQIGDRIQLHQKLPRTHLSRLS